ncbi:MAG: hypothetical protein PHI24_13185 [Desulfitobacteriaceae bacterium]|nr:hypothetical protein [Desulfitobacteriaceae bacterium]
MQDFIKILSAIPSQAWIAVTTALLASSLTLIGVWLTNRANNQRLKIQLEHERKTRNEEIMRDRLEEFYVLSNKYLNMLVGHYLPFRMVMEKEITFNQALDLVIESGSKSDCEPHRVTMLIDLYFPEVKPEFDKIVNVREKLNEIIDGYKKQYKCGDTDGSIWLNNFQPLFETLGVLTDGFEKNIAKLRR